MKKKKIIIITVLLLPVLIILFSNYSIERIAKGKTFTDISELSKNKVGLVLGTSKMSPSGGINLYFKYRIEATVELFKSGKIDFVLVSGDNGNKNYNEPSDFRDELVKRGIPANKIYLDYAGFRTLDSVVRAKEIFGQTSITIISQKFHNERAIYLAEYYDMDAIGFNAQDPAGNYGIKTQIREYFARTKAFLDIVTGVDPKFLGKKIEIK